MIGSTYVPLIIQDPRQLLHSRFSHGLIFNLLYRAVQQNSCSENITSLAVFLLELALSLPQTDYSGKEVAVSAPWLIVHEPVDLQYDTWFPTDWLSANLRYTVTAIFTNQPPGQTTSSMEVDQVRQASQPPSDLGAEYVQPQTFTSKILRIYYIMVGAEHEQVCSF